VLVDGERIRAVVSLSEIPANWPIDDVGNLVVMSGLVDTHVHINEPGRTEWEGFETATRAAAAGGITTLIDMPLNSSPVTTTLPALHTKRAAAEGNLFVDCGFYGGIVPGNTDQIEVLARAGALGFKAFLIHSGIDEFPNATEADLRAAMPIIAKHNLPLLVHCELQQSIAPALHASPRSYVGFLSSRPRSWEHAAIDLMIRLCREYRCRTHVVHLSSADAVPAIRQARNEGLPLTVETCPHYLYFSAGEISDGDTRFKCTPPIRERENRERLWDALREGAIDFIVSDHSPSPPPMKCLDSGDFTKAWGGISSLQLGLSIVWTEARRRGFSIADVARWMSSRPAQLVGLDTRKGSIAPAFDADLVVWNPEREFVIQEPMLRHRHRLTPYTGRTVVGQVERSFVRGREVFTGATIASESMGRIL
jgi:allantoinase